MASADLLTVQLGQGDVLNRPLYAAAIEYLKDGDLNFSGADTETIVKYVARVLELAYEGYDYFVKAYPLLLDYLTKQNQHGKTEFFLSPENLVQ